MILFVSGRTDVVAYYTSWFMNRYEEGFLDVRNPFYHKQVSRIYFNDVDAIVFCTKNPLPILPYIHKINKPMLFHVTLTSYKNDIEINVIDKKKIIEGIKYLSTLIPKENIYVRYDPILLNESYTLNYHKRAFKRLCEQLDGYVNHIIVSFVDNYKNVQKNMNVLKIREFKNEDYQFIGKEFYEIANEHHMTIQTCTEENTLFEYGFIKDDCLSKELAFYLTAKKFKRWKARGKLCNCVEMVDIGVYNTCSHLCKYCYANYDESQIEENVKQHYEDSTMLIGYLEEDDVVKVRK